jgi:dCMP deaminase
VLSKIRGLLGLTNIAENELRIDVRRTPWDITFLRQAIESASRSHDAETKCGCVLVRDNTILSGGYNGFIRGIDDTILPNKRPHKYPYMIHAEHNAILNCARNGVSTLGATAYVTTKPCFPCFQYLWQVGVCRIVYTDWSVSQNWNHSAADDQIEALMMLINPIITKFVDIDGTISDIFDENLVMEFIPKNDVLPKQ